MWIKHYQLGRFFRSSPRWKLNYDQRWLVGKYNFELYISAPQGALHFIPLFSVKIMSELHMIAALCYQILCFANSSHCFNFSFIIRIWVFLWLFIYVTNISFLLISTHKQGLKDKLIHRVASPIRKYLLWLITWLLQSI